MDDMQSANTTLKTSNPVLNPKPKKYSINESGTYKSFAK